MPPHPFDGRCQVDGAQVQAESGTDIDQLVELDGLLQEARTRAVRAEDDHGVRTEDERGLEIVRVPMMAGMAQA